MGRQFWIRDRSGGVQGPFPESKVRGYIAEGRVHASMHLSTDGETWALVAAFADLFPPTPVPPAPAPAVPVPAIPAPPLPAPPPRARPAPQRSVRSARPAQAGTRSRERRRAWPLVIGLAGAVAAGGVYLGTTGGTREETTRVAPDPPDSQEGSLLAPVARLDDLTAELRTQLQGIEGRLSEARSLRGGLVRELSLQKRTLREVGVRDASRDVQARALARQIVGCDRAIGALTTERDARARYLQDLEAARGQAQIEELAASLPDVPDDVLRQIEQDRVTEELGGGEEMVRSARVATVLEDTTALELPPLELPQDALASSAAATMARSINATLVRAAEAFRANEHERAEAAYREAVLELESLAASAAGAGSEELAEFHQALGQRIEDVRGERKRHEDALLAHEVEAASLELEALWSKAESAEQYEEVVRLCRRVLTDLSPTDPYARTRLQMILEVRKPSPEVRARAEEALRWAGRRAGDAARFDEARATFDRTVEALDLDEAAASLGVLDGILPDAKETRTARGRLASQVDAAREAATVVQGLGRAREPDALQSLLERAARLKRLHPARYEREGLARAEEAARRSLQGMATRVDERVAALEARAEGVDTAAAAEALLDEAEALREPRLAKSLDALVARLRGVVSRERDAAETARLAAQAEAAEARRAKEELAETLAKADEFVATLQAGDAVPLYRKVLRSAQGRPEAILAQVGLGDAARVFGDRGPARERDAQFTAALREYEEVLGYDTDARSSRGVSAKSQATYWIFTLHVIFKEGYEGQARRYPRTTSKYRSLYRKFKERHDEALARLEQLRKIYPSEVDEAGKTFLSRAEDIWSRSRR